MEVECERVIGGLRGVLLESYASLGLDPAQPQEASRQLGINKNLAWRISKIMTASDGLSTIDKFPGGSGWDIFLEALGRAGVVRSQQDQIREALRAFDQFVTTHAGSRSNLELILDSMGVMEGSGQLDVSRQIAFQGNSGIWGVQARTRLTAGFLAPSKTQPDRADAILIGGFLGFRCLRPGVSWPLFRFQSYDDKGALLELPRETVEPNGEGGALASLIRRFSSANLPPIKSVQVGKITEHVLQPTTVGNLGAFDCCFGDVIRGDARYRDEANTHADFGSSVNLPLETLLFDVFIHRELELSEPPALTVYGRPGGGPDEPSVRLESRRIPISERCVELVGRPPVVVTPLMPRYPELVGMAVARLGCTLGEFRGFRATLKYPPMPSSVVLRWPLAEAPK
jgi:hypothetical protein